MTCLVALMISVLYSLKFEVSGLGGSLVSVQFKLSGMDNQKNITWKHGCSGTLLSPRSALTCASCVVYQDDILGMLTLSSEELRLYGGDDSPDHADDDPRGQIAYVLAVKVHPEYFFSDVEDIPNEFDFAMLFAKKPFKIGESLKVLPLYSEDVVEVKEAIKTNGTACFTMTWYFYMDGRPVNEKPEWDEIPVAMASIDACRNLSNILLRLSNTKTLDPYSCAMGLKGLPICRVDTGSPIVCEGKLIAIVINERLDCDNDEAYVVISGINNAMAFLTKPETYGVSDSPNTSSARTTIVERGRSSLSIVIPEIATLVTAISILIYVIKGAMSYL